MEVVNKSFLYERDVDLIPEIWKSADGSCEFLMENIVLMFITISFFESIEW